MTPSPANTTELEIPSCHGCRRRKLKCSREQPSCANCQRSSESGHWLFHSAYAYLEDEVCVYDAKKNKPGVKVGAVEGLSRRLETLEQAFHDQTIQQNATASFDSSNVTSSIAHLTGAITSLASEIQRLSSSRRDPPPHASDFNGNGDDPDEIRSHKRRRVQGHIPESHIQQTVSPGGANQPLPPGLVEEVVHLYFDRVFYWIPVIHHPRFREEIKQVSGRQRLRVIIDAMLVATLRFIDGGRYGLSRDEIQCLVEERRNSVLISAMRSLSIENLQALVILAFTTIGNGEPSETWPIIASMTRTVDFLQLTMEGEHVKTRYLVPTTPLSTRTDWVQEEERRRVFWNVFNLDRYCSITTGWSTGIASDKINRRLPANGSYWYADTPVVSPYFAISVPPDAAISSPYAIAHTQCSTCGQVSTAETCSSSITAATGAGNPSLNEPSSPSSMGGFSYAVQATEYLNRIATCFLYPEVDFDDQQQVIAWLTRFKELDLQLVHWKMFLPKKWRDPNRAPDTSTGPHDLDHSMTLAHVTHNTSMILLHHRIAYPPSRQRQVVPLPSSCSAETCRLAATKTSNIAETWLRVCPEKIVVAPQIAFCTFISARLLLVHSRYYREPLMPEFWVLVGSLENMSRRWAGVTRGDSGPFPNLAGKYASHLKTIYERCQQDVAYTVAVLDYTENIEQATSYKERKGSWLQHPRAEDDNDDQRAMSTSISSQNLRPMPSHTTAPQDHVPPAQPQNISMATSPTVGVTAMVDQPEHTDSMSFTAANSHVQELPEDLLTISQALMDQRFAEMDRIITLDDSWFETTAQATDISTLHVPGWNGAEMRFTNLRGGEDGATGREWQGMQ